MWKKLVKGIEYWDKPVLGKEKGPYENRYMALCIDPSSKPGNYVGIARNVYQRKGNVNISGFFDLSRLILVKSKDLLKWENVKELEIEGIDNVIKSIQPKNTFFLGLEDPDIFTDEEGMKQVYFTVAYKYKNKKGAKVFLGHAQGISLSKLKATEPVIAKNKEVAISPIKSEGYRYILSESWNEKPEEGISLLKARNMGKDWEFKKLVFKPKNSSPKWVRGYASPCRIFEPKIFNIGNKILLGICNGNSGEYYVEETKYRGKFTPGLFLFNSKTGEIPWISDENLFEDPVATEITFASELIQINKKEFILYAHPNDSFVRAYKLNIDELIKMVPKEL